MRGFVNVLQYSIHLLGVKFGINISAGTNISFTSTSLIVPNIFLIFLSTSVL